jgi:ClpX C4-type zinc finger
MIDVDTTVALVALGAVAGCALGYLLGSRAPGTGSAQDRAGDDRPAGPTKADKAARQACCVHVLRQAREDRKVIAGPEALICDECVDLCVEGLEEEIGEDWRSPDGQEYRCRRPWTRGRWRQPDVAGG